MADSLRTDRDIAGGGTRFMPAGALPLCTGPQLGWWQQCPLPAGAYLAGADYVSVADGAWLIAGLWLGQRP